MVRATFTAGSRDGKLYILAAAALVCAAVFHLPALSDEFLPDPSGGFGLSLWMTVAQITSGSSFGGAAAQSACGFSFGLAAVTSCIRNGGLLCILLLISVRDTDHRIIPNRCILAMLILAVSCQAPMDLIFHLLSVALISVLLLLTYGMMRLLRLKTIRFLGGGDVKLLLVLGLFLNMEQVIYMLLLAGLFGLFSALTSFVHREKNFPFGPGICSAAAISLFLLPG